MIRLLLGESRDPLGADLARATRRVREEVLGGSTSWS
jgi:hypothetical protein